MLGPPPPLLEVGRQCRQRAVAADAVHRRHIFCRTLRCTIHAPHTDSMATNNTADDSVDTRMRRPAQHHSSRQHSARVHTCSRDKQNEQYTGAGALASAGGNTSASSVGCASRFTIDVFVGRVTKVGSYMPSNILVVCAVKRREMVTGTGQLYNFYPAQMLHFTRTIQIESANLSNTRTSGDHLHTCLESQMITIICYKDQSWHIAKRFCVYNSGN
jgi:hypothetical protein